MVSRWMTLLVWALVAGSGVFWALKLFARPLAVPPQAVVAAPGVAAGGDLSRLFGVVVVPPPVVAAQALPPPESARFQLIGAMASPSAARSQGVALIAVDGKLPRAYRVGALIDGELVLQSVQPRGVSIGPRGGDALISLELPPLPPPSTGVPGAAQGTAAPVSPAVPQPGLPAAALRLPAPPSAVVQPPQLAVPPPQLAVPPPGPGGGLSQQPFRQRGMRTLTTPTGVVQVPVQLNPGQSDEGAPAEPALVDNRNLR